MSDKKIYRVKFYNNIVDKPEDDNCFYQKTIRCKYFTGKSREKVARLFSDILEIAEENKFEELIVLDVFPLSSNRLIYDSWQVWFYTSKKANDNSTLKIYSPMMATVFELDVWEFDKE